MEKRAKDQLIAIRDAQKRLFIMAERSDMLRATLYGNCIRYDKDKVQTSASDVFGDRMADIVQRVKYIRKRQVRLDMIKDSMRLSIWQIDGDQYRDALELYYLGVMEGPRLYTWKDVAIEIGTSEKYLIHTVHPKALKLLDNILYMG